MPRGYATGGDIEKSSEASKVNPVISYPFLVLRMHAEYTETMHITHRLTLCCVYA